MIRGVTIRNFRGLRETSVDGFARVNVIVGDNGSGKTSLLEALFMGMSSSALSAPRLRELRGLVPFGSDWPQDILDQVTSDFIGEAGDEAIVETFGDGNFSRTFSARPDPSRAVSFSPSSLGQEAARFPSSNVVPPPIVYHWTDADGNTDAATLQAGKAPMAFGSGGTRAVETAYLGHMSGSQGAAATLFSELDKNGQSAPVTSAIQEQFSFVESISVQLDGGNPLLHAKIRGLRKQRPLESVSGGLVALTLLLLAISRPTTAIVLVDEIENGLHHQRLPLLWRQVREFATRADTQVFATTHSLECLDAAADAMAEHPDDFTLLRAVRTDDGCKIGLLPGADARELLRSGLEVRG